MIWTFLPTRELLSLLPANILVWQSPKTHSLVELLKQSYYVHDPDAGLYEPTAKLGTTVKKGQLAGIVRFVDNPEREPIPVYFTDCGFLICKRHNGRVDRGDCVAHLATDAQEPA